MLQSIKQYLNTRRKSLNISICSSRIPLVNISMSLAGRGLRKQRQNRTSFHSRVVTVMNNVVAASFSCSNDDSPSCEDDCR